MFDNKTGSSVVTRYILTKYITPVHYSAVQRTIIGKNVRHFFVNVLVMGLIRDEDRKGDIGSCPLLQSLEKVHPYDTGFSILDKRGRAPFAFDA